MQTSNKDYDPRRDYDQDRNQGRARRRNIYAGTGDFDADYGDEREPENLRGGGGDYDNSGYDSGDQELPDYAGTPREHDIQQPYGEPLRRRSRNEALRGIYAGRQDRDRRYGHPYGGSGQGTRYGFGYDMPARQRTEAWRQRGPHSGRGPAGYRRPDERIEDEAHERLTRHGALDASGIRLSVRDGVITLEGTVPERGDKRRAEDALASIAGVADISNRLRARGS